MRSRPSCGPAITLKLRSATWTVREVGTDAVITVVEVLSPRLECFYLTRVE